jgi:hypothetical protein
MLSANGYSKKRINVTTGKCANNVNEKRSAFSEQKDGCAPNNSRTIRESSIAIRDKVEILTGPIYPATKFLWEEVHLVNNAMNEFGKVKRYLQRRYQRTDGIMDFGNLADPLSIQHNVNNACFLPLKFLNITNYIKIRLSKSTARRYPAIV